MKNEDRSPRSSNGTHSLSKSIKSMKHFSCRIFADVSIRGKQNGTLPWSKC